MSEVTRICEIYHVFFQLSFLGSYSDRITCSESCFLIFFSNAFSQLQEFQIVDLLSPASAMITFRFQVVWPNHIEAQPPPHCMRTFTVNGDISMHS